MIKTADVKITAYIRTIEFIFYSKPRPELHLSLLLLLLLLILFYFSSVPRFIVYDPHPVLYEICVLLNTPVLTTKGKTNRINLVTLNYIAQNTEKLLLLISSTEMFATVFPSSEH